MTSPSENSGYLASARMIGVVTLVLSIISIVVNGLMVLAGVEVLVSALNDPDAFVQSVQLMPEFRQAFLELGLGTAMGTAQAAWLALVSVTAGIAVSFAFAIMMLCSSIALIRLPQNPENGYRTFALAVAGGVMAFFSARLVSAALLVVAAVIARKDYLQRHGEAELSNEKHLGLMRLIEVGIVLLLVVNASILLFVTQSSTYDASYWVSFIQMILMSVSLWVLMTRKEHGCTIIRVAILIYLVLDLIVQIATGRFSIVSYLVSIVIPVGMLIYFSTSKRAKAVLVRPFRMESRQESLAEEEKLWNLKSPAFWRNLLLYFCIFSVVGHWMEYWVCWLIRLGLVPGTYDPNSGIWHDMLNPFFVYGAAFVFIGLLLYPFKLFMQRKTSSTLLALGASFIANTLLCAAIELAMGLVLNDHLQLWDYSNMAFNFMGQICLLNTTFFGIMATLMTWLVYPNLEKAFARIPHDVMNIITVMVIVFFVLVVCMYVVNVALPGNMNAVLSSFV